MFMHFNESVNVIDVSSTTVTNRWSNLQMHVLAGDVEHMLSILETTKSRF